MNNVGQISYKCFDFLGKLHKITEMPYKIVRKAVCWENTLFGLTFLGFYEKMASISYRNEKG